MNCIGNKVIIFVRRFLIFCDYPFNIGGRNASIHRYYGFTLYQATAGCKENKYIQFIVINYRLRNLTTPDNTIDLIHDLIDV